MPGQVLCLGTPGADCNNTYVVEPNDTCEKVAAAHSTDLGVLYHNNPQLNGKCDNMYIGEVCLFGFSTDVMRNFTHHRYYAWPALIMRLHSPLVRFQLPRYPRRHIQQPRICHGVIRPCLGALNGLSYPFNSFHGWPHVECSGAGGLVFIYSSAYLPMAVSRAFLIHRY